VHGFHFILIVFGGVGLSLFLDSVVITIYSITVSRGRKFLVFSLFC
jgi:hypothetical protein